MKNIENTESLLGKSHWDKSKYPEFRTNSAGEKVETIWKHSHMRPTNDLFTLFYSEPRLRQFFNNLSEKEISNIEDLEQYTADELFELTPIKDKDRKIFMAYVEEGYITLKNEI